MTFQYFLRPLVERWYYRARNWLTQINWSSFGSTDTYRPQSFNILPEPADGEAVAPRQ